MHVVYVVVSVTPKRRRPQTLTGELCVCVCSHTGNVFPQFFNQNLLLLLTLFSVAALALINASTLQRCGYHESCVHCFSCVSVIQLTKGNLNDKRIHSVRGMRNEQQVSSFIKLGLVRGLRYPCNCVHRAVPRALLTGAIKSTNEAT